MSIVLRDRAGLEALSLATIEAAVRDHVTLERVVRWALAAAPARAIRQVVKQDEYTQDVVVQHDGTLHLVYDST